jgi:hypothetical protein
MPPGRQEVIVVTDHWDREDLGAPPPVDYRLAAAGDDEQLLAALRQAIGARRRVPPEFVQAARDAYAWHDIDAELAQLTYDSVLGAGSAAVTRAEDASIRALTFSSPRLRIELEVTSDSLLGQVIPTQVTTVEVQTQAGPGPAGPAGRAGPAVADTVVSSDEIGCFSIQPVPSGPFRLRCLAPGGIDVRTGWITL